MLWLLLVMLIALTFIGLPGFGPWQHSYGYVPSGLGLVLFIILLVLLLGGRL